MRIDSHHHFWNYSPTEHVWMTDEYSAIRRNFGPDELNPLTEAAGVSGTVVVQARQNLAETEWLLMLSQRFPTILGVVGWVDLCAPDVNEQLSRFAVPGSRLKGVRHVLHDEPDDRYMLRNDFQRGIAQLADYSMTYDLLLFPRHLKYALELVTRFADQPFVLDHLGKPDIAHGEMEPWRTGIVALADCRNVYCKISGLLTLAEWNEWSAPDFTPYVDVLIEAFGPDRLMLGSDWPVCTVSGGYSESIHAVDESLNRLSVAEREQIESATATEFYRLDH